MEDFIPIVAIISVFGFIPVTIWIISHFNARKRLTGHETLRLAVEKGQELSPELLDKMSQFMDPVRADLRRGVLCIAVGLAFAFLGWMIGMEEGEAVRPMLGVAAFPVFLGLAYLGLWVSGRNDRKA